MALLEKTTETDMVYVILPPSPKKETNPTYFHFQTSYKTIDPPLKPQFLNLLLLNKQTVYRVYLTLTEMIIGFLCAGLCHTKRDLVRQNMEGGGAVLIILGSCGYQWYCVFFLSGIATENNGQNLDQFLLQQSRARFMLHII